MDLSKNVLDDSMLCLRERNYHKCSSQKKITPRENSNCRSSVVVVSKLIVFLLVQRGTFEGFKARPFLKWKDWICPLSDDERRSHSLLTPLVLMLNPTIELNQTWHSKCFFPLGVWIIRWFDIILMFQMISRRFLQNRLQQIMRPYITIVH